MTGLYLLTDQTGLLLFTPIIYSTSASCERAPTTTQHCAFCYACLWSHMVCWLAGHISMRPWQWNS